MISSISSWAQQVVIAVIIGTIIEMILPKGNSKKYIKTVIGVYILYTIVSPIISNFSEGYELDLSKYENYFESEDVNYVEGYSIEDTYKNEITKQIASDLEDMGFIATNIDFDFDMETGEIKNLSLFVTKGSNVSEENSIHVEVNRVLIGSDEGNSLSEDEVNGVKEFLYLNYGTETACISVNDG